MTAAVPPEVYRCSAAANEQAADPHYRRDLERDIKHGSQQHLLRSTGRMVSVSSN